MKVKYLDDNVKLIYNDGKVAIIKYYGGRDCYCVEVDEKWPNIILNFESYVNNDDHSVIMKMVQFYDIVIDYTTSELSVKTELIVMDTNDVMKVFVNENLDFIEEL